MELRVENVLFSKRKKEIKQIYMSSFDKRDRMPFSMMVAMSCLWNTEFLAFYDGDVLCGFVYMATIGRQSFLMFFAVDESLRSKGYGSRILDCVSKRHPKSTIVVSIEPCNQPEADDIAMRLRRRDFYIRNGFNITDYYMKFGKIQEILVKGGVFSKPRFRLFFALYTNLTMYPKIWKG